MIVDAHHHLWTADYPWLAATGLETIRRDYTAMDLQRNLAVTGVDATVLVEAARCDIEETLSFLAFAAETPEIAGVVGWASFTDPDIVSTVDELRQGTHGRWLVGIRDQVQGEHDPQYLARPDVRRSLAVIGAAGLAVDLVVRRDQLPACAEAAASTPDTRFVLDHLGKPVVSPDGLREWRDLVGPLVSCPNVTAKLSGLLTEIPAATGDVVAAIAPFVAAALDLFGPGRLMVGSDWPVCELVASYADTWHALASCLVDLSADERDAVFGATAIRAYRLEVPR